MSQVQREAYERDQTLTKQLRDMTAKKDEIEEELTRYENQDRVIREKCDQLESKGAKLQQQVDQQDYELIKHQKDVKELLEDKDQLLAKVHDAETSKDNMYAELLKARAANTDLDMKIKESEELIQNNNPVIIKQQKELIFDLKQRVSVLEKEVLLVNASTSKELADLRK